MLKTSFVSAVLLAPLAWATCADECQYQGGGAAQCSTTGSTRTCIWTYYDGQAAGNAPGNWNPPVGASNVQFMLIGGPGGDVDIVDQGYSGGGAGANITFGLPTTADIQLPQFTVYPGQYGGSVTAHDSGGAAGGSYLGAGGVASIGGGNGGSGTNSNSQGGAGGGSGSALLGDQNGAIAPYGIAGGGGGASAGPDGQPAGQGGDAGLDDPAGTLPAAADGSSGSFTNDDVTYSITAALGSNGNNGNGGTGGTFAPSSATGTNGNDGSYNGETASGGTAPNTEIGGGNGVNGPMYGSGGGGGGYAGGGGGAVVTSADGTQQLSGGGGAGGSFIQEDGGFTTNGNYATAAPGSEPLVQVTYTVLLNGSGQPTRRKLARRSRLAARYGSGK